MEEAMKVTGETLTPEQKKTIRTAFKSMDENGDGRISQNELRRACKKLGILLTREEVSEIMVEGDKDGNGTIEFREFEKAIGHQLVIKNYKNKYMRDVFSRFDLDGDGFITGAEIRKAFGEMGVDLSDEDVEELIKEADENGDGVISFEEFVQSVCEKDW